MKEIITKLRMMCSIWRLRLKLFWAEITAPFRFAAKYAERYSELKKIDEESEDRWERHVKLSELKQKDELELRRSQFFLKKTQVIGSFFRTAMNAECFLQFHHYRRRTAGIFCADSSKGHCPAEQSSRYSIFFCAGFRRGTAPHSLFLLS